jgi:hypothetical protein
MVLSTDMQHWRGYHVFQLPKSTAKCELMDMSHYHESCMSRFVLFRGLVGCKGSICRSVYRVRGSLETQARPWTPYGAQYIIWKNNNDSL